MTRVQDTPKIERQDRTRTDLIHVVDPRYKPYALCGYKCREVWVSLGEPTDCVVCAELERARR